MTAVDDGPNAPTPLPAPNEGRFWQAAREAERFFKGEADVNQVLRQLARVLHDVARLPLPVLVELELASGMSAAHRLKDLADVLELIRAAKLPEELADRLDPSVRDKYRELWQAAQTHDDE